MPTFDFTAPDGKSYSVQGPEGATPEQAFQILQSQIGGGAPPAAAPVSANDVVRSTATGVPIVGGALNKLDAATNAALAPLLNRFFAPENQLPEENFSDRYSHSLRDQEGGDKKFAAEHPIVDTAAKLTGGVASMVPVMAAAPAAFGLSGPMSTMIRNGATSGAALSAADAAVRGEDIGSAAGIGGVIGGAAGPVGKGVGKVVSSIADRLRPMAPVPQNIAKVGNVDIPLSSAEATQNAGLSAEQQVIQSGGRGVPAQEAAQSFKDLQASRVNQARDEFSAGLDPTGANASTAPQDAAEKIASELIAQEQARQAAAAANVAQVGQEGGALARGFDPAGQMRAPSAGDAAETISERLAAARDAAKADYRAKYDATAQAPGEFAPGSAAGFRGDVENGLRAADHPVSLDETNTPKALNALGIIDKHLNTAGPAAPKAGVEAQTAADIRAKYGDEVAAAYQRQKAAAPVSGASSASEQPNPKIAANPQPAGGAVNDWQRRPPASWVIKDKANGSIVMETFDPKMVAALNTAKYEAVPILDHLAGLNKPAAAAGLSTDKAGLSANVPAADAGPKAQSLLEFLASKGGLGPDAELEAIGAHGHTVNVEGAGRRKLVKQGGWPLDYAREAAEEAGYLRGDHKGTSTVNDLLDAMDAEMRGRKLYPAGHEGAVGKREAGAISEREQHELDRHIRGLEDDLAAAGHGELGPDVKARAVKLMSSEGMGADNAVEHALHQLEQEDAAGAILNKPKAASDFPGDRAAPEPAAGSGFTMRDVEQVRKQLSTLYGDARRAMLGGGSGADVHALEHITEHFDARVRQMVADGKFSGDGPAVLKSLEDARASFSDYKQKFSRRGAGDSVGAAVEKILGKFSDTKATPDVVVNLAYGSANAPGGQMPVQIAQRIAKIFGRDSAEFGAYKQGLFSHLTQGDPEKAAARINAFLSEPKGKLLSQTVFDAGERGRLARYADRLSGIVPKENEPGAVAAAIRRYSGADGAPPASINQIVGDLMGSTGKGNGRLSVQLAARLKQDLSPDAWNGLRQGMFEKLTNAGEGKIAFEAQALSQRLHEFLNESGSQLAKTLYSPKELELLTQLASVYKQMIPVKGTTNPSGTAPMLAKMASGLRHTLLPLLGLTHGGIPGAAIAYAADKGLTGIANQNAARNATRLLYGKQAERAVNPNFAKASGLIAQGEENQRRARSK